MSSQRSPREVLRLVFEQRYLVAGIALSVFFLALLAGMVLPRRYESFTKVRVVDNPALYDLYGRSLAGAKDDTTRIRAINQEILSTSLLSKVIKEVGLDDELSVLDEREAMEKREEMVRTIQQNTRVDLTEKSRGQFIFRISHTCGDPVLAQRLVTHLSTGYQGRQYAEQKSSAAETLDVVRKKIAETGEEFDIAAGKLAAFEKEHEAHRFGEEGDTRSRLAQERGKLDAVALEIQEVELRLKNLREQLLDEAEWVKVDREVDNTASIETIKREILAAEQVLLGYQLKYTDAHPKVVEQKERIEHLEKKLAEEDTKVRTVSRKERNPTWVELKKSEMEAVTNLTVKREIRSEYAKRVGALEARMQAYPALKNDWETLVERRDAMRIRKDKLREQEQTALLTWQTKVAESAMIFDVLDPPTFPLRPVSPNRTLIGLAGLLLGLAGGVGVVVARDLMDSSFRNSDDLLVTTGVQVIGSISPIVTMLEREETLKKKRLALMGIAALVLACAGIVFVQVGFEDEFGSYVQGTTEELE